MESFETFIQQRAQHPVARNFSYDPGTLLQHNRRSYHGVTSTINIDEHAIPDIPEQDLIVLKKLYHKRYPNCGRKRGALLRSIKYFKEEYEPKPIKKEFFTFLKKLANKT